MYIEHRGGHDWEVLITGNVEVPDGFRKFNAQSLKFFFNDSPFKYLAIMWLDKLNPQTFTFSEGTWPDKINEVAVPWTSGKMRSYTSLQFDITSVEFPERKEAVSYSNEKEEVYLDFARVEIFLPESAFTKLESAIKSRIKDPLADLIDCQRIIPLKDHLPKFLFTNPNSDAILFTLSGPNYFVRVSKTECKFVVQLSEKKRWVIGAALTKTHMTTFRKFPDDETFAHGFVKIETLIH